jgi:hypothetical protein
MSEDTTCIEANLTLGTCSYDAISGVLVGVTESEDICELRKRRKRGHFLAAETKCSCLVAK